MKKTCILVLGALTALTSCGMIAQSSSSDDGHRFSDGIYGNIPSFKTKEEKTEARTENETLVSKTKESPIYLFGDRKDTIMIPDNFSASIRFDQKVGGTVVTVGENPYDWMWDLENRYGYYYGPYSIGSTWYWSRHYNPYWSSWTYSPWRYYGYYAPWYYGGFYDPWYYGSFYDPWYYGGYWGGYYAGYWGWNNPWYHYHHHHGWYDPHPHHGPSHTGGAAFGKSTYQGLRAHTEGISPRSGHSSASARSTVTSSRGGVRTGSSVNRSVRPSGSTAGRTSAGTRVSSESSTRAGTVSRPSSSSPKVSGARSTTMTRSATTAYRRPSTSYNSTDKASSGYERQSSYSRESNYDRSSSSGSYSRGSSGHGGSSSGYSRGSSSYGGGSSSYNRGSSSGRSGSSGSYRR